jgi:hypothetical protein
MILTPDLVGKGITSRFGVIAIFCQILTHFMQKLHDASMREMKNLILRMTAGTVKIRFRPLFS